MSELPILYSFRRCPYAMRARMALAYSDTKTELREVSLKNKPQEMLEASPKGTVPVLVLANGDIIDESLDILYFALSKNDPDGWNSSESETSELIEINDGEFKSLLNKYKYPDRNSENSQEFYREEAEKVFLKALEERLNKTRYLTGENISVADIAIFPFIRQFAAVDDDWFNSSPYKKLRKWLDEFAESPLFETVMVKHDPWVKGDKQVIFP